MVYYGILWLYIPLQLDMINWLNAWPLWLWTHDKASCHGEGAWPSWWRFSTWVCEEAMEVPWVTRVVSIPSHGHPWLGGDTLGNSISSTSWLCKPHKNYRYINEKPTINHSYLMLIPVLHSEPFLQEHYPPGCTGSPSLNRSPSADRSLRFRHQVPQNEWG